MKYLINIDEQFKGFTQSIVYIDTMIVAYSGGKTLSEYMQDKPFNYLLLDWDELDAMIQNFENEQYLSNPPTVITEDEYNHQLGELPPEAWGSQLGFESFRMCEYMTGNITAMYATSKNIYLTKMVRVDDPDTFIKQSDFN